MNQHLQNILTLIEQAEQLSEEQKAVAFKALKDADKEFEITAFKLDRTDKVKRTTAILLEETIEELEQKRKSVEAQNRELEIEASLERVRTVAMSMSKAEDLLLVCKSVYSELQLLGFKDLRNGLIHSYHDEKKEFDDYDYSDFTKGHISRIPYTGNAIIENFIKEIRSSKDAFTEIAITGNDLIVWRSFRDANNEAPDERLAGADALYYYFYSVGNASLGISTFSSITETQQAILKRFRNVFDLAYKRYVDISNAEAQAREAQIEASLERVRASAMAMHNSEDLASTIKIFYQQIGLLSETPRRCGIDIIDKESHTVAISSMNTTADGKPLEAIGEISLRGHRVLEEIYDNWLLQKEYFPVLKDEEIKEYYDFVRPHVGYPDYKQDEVHYGHFFPFPEGCIYVWTINTLSENELEIYRRFTSVLSLTYKRFKDLQKAEEQTREAQIEAALERVRAKAMSMQKSEDLSDAVAVVFEEMDKLNLGMLRCGIGILDKEKRTADVFSTTITEGDKTVQVSGDESMDIHPLLKGAFDTWLEGIDHDYVLEGDDLVDYYTAVSKTNFQLPESQKILDRNQRQYYFRATFNEGGLFAFRDTPFPDEAKMVMKRFAAVFDLTYKRFLDLQRAEAHALQAEQDLVAIKEAKQKAEEAFTELQATQKQLIQSEKMASLGELTAGIAHEIQNPLNFVNNFSEVSKELLDEMKEAIEKGNTADAKDIMNDVIQNLEKIHHHGKRADGIVKGMLQHSRTGSNQKELTDINALIDEYLRLAYHGLRAKDKSFNAKFETDFDPAVGKINVMPQDIGRVILNLINNAFYATNERKKLNETGYEPTVTVITSRVGNDVEITVKDNGTGIPKSLVEKIFQPFFTTKPTGQGTGLGLSLAYDIVKAHGGEINASTREGEGSKFILKLPTS